LVVSTPALLLRDGRFQDRAGAPVDWRARLALRAQRTATTSGNRSTRAAAARRGPNIYIPVRYFHRPRGVDDGSGLSKPSRFLTDEVESLCELVQPTESPPPLVGAQVHEQVTVVVDALWR
jgi:hypothetical protein